MVKPMPLVKDSKIKQIQMRHLSQHLDYLVSQKEEEEVEEFWLAHNEYIQK